MPGRGRSGSSAPRALHTKTAMIAPRATRGRTGRREAGFVGGGDGRAGAGGSVRSSGAAVLTPHRTSRARSRETASGSAPARRASSIVSRASASYTISAAGPVQRAAHPARPATTSPWPTRVVSARAGVPGPPRSSDPHSVAGSVPGADRNRAFDAPPRIRSLTEGTRHHATDSRHDRRRPRPPAREVCSTRCSAAPTTVSVPTTTTAPTPC